MKIGFRNLKNRIVQIATDLCTLCNFAKTIRHMRIAFSSTSMGHELVLPDNNF